MASIDQEISRRRSEGTWAGGSDEGSYGPGYSWSQQKYQTDILPTQVQAVEEQVGAMREAVKTEEGAAAARARDIGRRHKAATPGGFETTLRGAITQEAGEALGYEGALRGAKAWKELQDPSQLAPIVKEREQQLTAITEEMQEGEQAGQAVAAVSAGAGAVVAAAGAVIATTTIAGAATAQAGPIGALIGAGIALTGLIIGGIMGAAARSRGRERSSSAKKKYDPSKVKQVSFATALGAAQKGPRGYVQSQFTGGSALGPGIGSRIQNLGGMAPGQAAPWMQFAGVKS